MQLSSATVDFYLFYDWLVDMQKCGLWTRSQCRVSDTQVIIKACGLIVPGERWLRRLYNTDLIAGLYLNKRPRGL